MQQPAVEEAPQVVEAPVPPDTTPPDLVLLPGDGREGELQLAGGTVPVLIHRLTVGSPWTDPGYRATDDRDAEADVAVARDGASSVTGAKPTPER